MAVVDYEEVVGLQMLPASAQVPLTAQAYLFEPSKLMPLAKAVRFVVEEATLMQRRSAMIHRDGQAALTLPDIEKIYARVDFPRA
jgi:hypothetical protein